MPNIDFNGNPYFSYATIAEADLYISPTEYGEIWDLLDDDKKASNLISASRFLDTLPWKKHCGETQEDRANNPNIVQACMEIAARLAAGENDIISGGSSDGGIQTLKAGSAQLTYFQKKSWKIGTGTTTALLDGLPANILALISDCLATAPRGLVGGVRTFGTCEQSTLDESWKIA